MEFIKKVLFLCMIPTSVALATRSEDGKSLLRKRALNQNVKVGSILTTSSQYSKDFVESLKELKTENNVLDATKLESTIAEEARKPYAHQIGLFQKQINAFHEGFQNHLDRADKAHNYFMKRVYPRTKLKFFGLGALTGLLVASAYSNYSKIINSYMPTNFFNRTK